MNFLSNFDYGMKKWSWRGFLSGTPPTWASNATSLNPCPQVGLSQCSEGLPMQTLTLTRCLAITCEFRHGDGCSEQAYARLYQNLRQACKRNGHATAETRSAPDA